MQKTRCKFQVMDINEDKTQIAMNPVMYNKDGDFEVPEENKIFWEATPSGRLDLSITNNSFSGVEIGDQFYLDIIPI